MRILHTHEDYNDWSGSRSLKLLSEELVRRGHEVTVLTGGSARRAESMNGVAVHRFPLAGNVARGISGSRGHIRDYWRAILHSGADVMLNYAAQTWATDLVFPLLPRLAMKKVFVPCGYSKLSSPAYRAYFDSLPARLSQYDRIVYLSGAYQDMKFGDARGVHSAENHLVIPNAADAAEFDANPTDFRKKYGITTPHLVLAVGNHYRAKNHPLLIRIAAQLPRDLTTVAIIGKPSPRKWAGCYYLCKAAGVALKSVRIFDGLERKDVVSAFHAADIFLHTSSVECDPIVLYEAFASKTPVVAMAAGSIPEFEDHVHIASGAASAARAIRLLLEQPEKRLLAAEHGHRLWRERYTLARMVNAYEDLYTSLVRRAATA